MTERHTPTHHDPREAGRYEIRLTGHLDARWGAWFDGMTVSRRPTGPPSSAARSSTRRPSMACSSASATLALPLISVQQVETDPSDPPIRDAR